MRRSARGVAVAATVLAAVVGSVTATAATASASSATTHAAKVGPHTSGKFTNHTTVNGVNIRSGPGTNFPVVGTVALTSQGIADYCDTTGDNCVGGNPYWDLVYDPYNRIGGFVTEYYLANGSQTLGC